MVCEVSRTGVTERQVRKAVELMVKDGGGPIRIEQEKKDREGRRWNLESQRSWLSSDNKCSASS